MSSSWTAGIYPKMLIIFRGIRQPLSFTMNIILISKKDLSWGENALLRKPLFLVSKTHFQKHLLKELQVKKETSEGECM